MLVKAGCDSLNCKLAIKTLKFPVLSCAIHVRSITILKKVCSADFSPQIAADRSPHYERLVCSADFSPP